MHESKVFCSVQIRIRNSPRGLWLRHSLVTQFFIQYSRGEKCSVYFPPKINSDTYQITRSRRNSFSVCCPPQKILSKKTYLPLSKRSKPRQNNNTKHEKMDLHIDGIKKVERERPAKVLANSFLLFRISPPSIYTSHPASHQQENYTLLNRSSGFVSAVIRGAADGSLANWWLFFCTANLRFFSNGHPRKLEKHLSLIALRIMTLCWRVL